MGPFDYPEVALMGLQELRQKRREGLECEDPVGS